MKRSAAFVPSMTCEARAAERCRPVLVRAGDSGAPSESGQYRRFAGGTWQPETVQFGKAIGACPAMRTLFACLESLAPHDVTVLLEGETGTGKDILAQAIHEKSRRSAGPFVVFDCGAVSANLIESELFGHERGAFTGAGASRAGVFEQAQGGTLFLDELGELPLELQPKLLRALENRQVKRLGGSRITDVDVRVVGATNRRLAQQVENGKFRADLYYRLETAHLTVPALRERLEDLPLLVEHFAKDLSLAHGSRSIAPDVWQHLKSYNWPGNVRELRNAVQRYFLLPDASLPKTAASNPARHNAWASRAIGTSTELRSPAAAAETPRASVEPLQLARRRATEAFEREYVCALLAQACGSVTRAAELAGISRQMMTRLAKKYRAASAHVRIEHLQG